MDFERKEVIPIEYMDKLKERVEEYLQENEISALAFCKLAQINELKFYLWINNNNYNLDVLTRSAIVGFMNTHK